MALRRRLEPTPASGLESLSDYEVREMWDRERSVRHLNGPASREWGRRVHARVREQRARLCEAGND